jgi:hypothetical protein
MAIVALCPGRLGRTSIPLRSGKILLQESDLLISVRGVTPGTHHQCGRRTSMGKAYGKDCGGRHDENSCHHRAGLGTRMRHRGDGATFRSSRDLPGAGLLKTVGPFTQRRPKNCSGFRRQRGIRLDCYIPHVSCRRHPRHHLPQTVGRSRSVTWPSPAKRSICPNSANRGGGSGSPTSPFVNSRFGDRSLICR